MKRLAIWAAALADRFRAPRCLLCRERTRHMPQHMWWDHGYEEVPR